VVRLPVPATGGTALLSTVELGQIVPVPQTVLIVDDHAGFRHAARVLLEADGFHVVGESATGGDGLAAAERLRPDLILLDIQLPDLDGMEVCHRIRSWDGPAVVLTSSRDASDYPPHFDHCGARGFIPKAELSGTALAALAA
jgi:DNA-binding NarL/FixJ family response regulator